MPKSIQGIIYARYGLSITGGISVESTIVNANSQFLNFLHMSKIGDYAEIY